MKFEYIPENEAEKKLLHEVLHASDNASDTHTFEERLSFLEKQSAKSIIRDIVTADMLERILTQEDEDEEEVQQKILDDLENIKRSINLLHQTTLELEEYKVRLRNTESDLRQALEKISSLEQSVAFLKSDMEGVRMSEKATARVINTHADQLDRLNKAVFDEDLTKVEEEEA